MHDRTAELEARLTAMAGALRTLEGRVAALESGANAASAEARREATLAAAVAVAERGAPAREATVTTLLSLLGRTLLVLAGAFVLRALTDTGRLPTAVGAGLGFVYAGVWIALADRAGRARQPVSAGFHGAAAVLIGFPLLFEAATRFQLVSPAVATLLLALLTGVALGVAAWRALPGLAWAIGLGGVATAGALMIVGGRFLAPALYLILLGVGALWIGYTRDWFGLRWPIALAADLALVAVAMRAVAPTVVEGPRVAFALQALLLAAYLGSIAIRTLLLDRDVVTFEIAQTAAALVVGLGGATYVAARTGMGSAGFGAASIALGVAAYGVALAFTEQRQTARNNYYFYATIGLLMVLVGSALALPPVARGVAWGTLALVAAAFARWKGRRSFAVHGVAYAMAAAFGSGLVQHAVMALRAPPGTAVGRPAGRLAPGPRLSRGLRLDRRGRRRAQHPRRAGPPAPARRGGRLRGRRRADWLDRPARRGPARARRQPGRCRGGPDRRAGGRRPGPRLGRPVQRMARGGLARLPRARRDRAQDHDRGPPAQPAGDAPLLVRPLRPRAHPGAEAAGEAGSLALTLTLLPPQAPARRAASRCDTRRRTTPRSRRASARGRP